jgi:transposase
MQILEKATRVCPMCNEINHIEVGQTEFNCARCGYKEGNKKIILG